MLCGSFEASATVNALSAIGPVGGVVTKILFSAIPNTCGPHLFDRDGRCPRKADVAS
jgi:hypothetical protein